LNIHISFNLFFNQLDLPNKRISKLLYQHILIYFFVTAIAKKQKLILKTQMS